MLRAGGMTRPRLARLIGHAVGATALVALAVMTVRSAGADTTSGAPPAFTGTVSAFGAELNVTTPGFPITNTPVDSGGPTAQVTANSLGTTTGYAAFPDPGAFVTTLPGLGVGLLASGVAGLPGIKVPSPPPYPFFVQSSAATPQVSAGAGPYNISATSETGGGTASATAGVSTGATGNAGLLASTASIASSTSGVTATATSDMQGLTVGPLSLGEVKSIATETMDSSGTVTPSTTLEIIGAQVGGLSLNLSPVGFTALGPTFSVPLNSTLASLLSGSSIKMTFVAAQSYPGKVVAPALEITMPFSIPGVSVARGSLTLSIGGASAALTGAVPASGVGSGTPSSTLTSGSQTLSSGGSGASASSGLTAPTFSPGGSSPGGVSSPGSLGAPPAGTSGPSAGGLVAAPASPQLLATSSSNSMDFRHLYLMLAAAGVAGWILSQLIRLLGVRKKWTSIGG